MVSDYEINAIDNESYRESCPNITAIVSRKIAKSCSVNGLKRRLPVTDWLPKYQKSYFLADLIAGITVGLTCIPQGASITIHVNCKQIEFVVYLGIANAVIAGLPPQYGLYSSFMCKYCVITFRPTMIKRNFLTQAASCT